MASVSKVCGAPPEPAAAAAGITRRRLLEAGGGLLLTLSLAALAPRQAGATGRDGARGTGEPRYEGWEDLYRAQWRWDAITHGCHSNGCMPGSCPFHVYARDGVVWREEQVAPSAPRRDRPDYNPLGCQKGAGFHDLLYGGHRLKYPVKRLGARGEGRWQRITWGEALTEIADAVIDAVEEQGSDSFVLDAPHVHAGSVAFAAAERATRLLGGTHLPAMEIIGDNYAGLLATFGKHFLGYSYDNVMDAELIVLTHENTAYTRPPFYHFLAEARYGGTEIFQLAPDYNATSPVATTHVPVKVATDAAFWLGVCHHLERRGLYDAAFLKEQTDLPLLVDTETGRFLRASEVDGGREDQLFYFDARSGAVTRAPRGTLAVGGDPALLGTYTVGLRGGGTARVTPVFELLRKHLAAYSPEAAARICGVDPALMVELAEKMAARRTCVHYGLTSGKHYHGDLMERSLLLALAMTGNWGKPGTGIVSYGFSSAAIDTLAALDQPAPAGLAPLAQWQEEVRRRVLEADPEATEELVQIELARAASLAKGATHSTLFLWHHAGYRDLWDRAAWRDPAMRRSLGETIAEAISRGWLVPDGLTATGREPRILLLIGANPLRRVKQARSQYVGVLLPKCKLVWAIETRLSSSAMYADIVLPAAWYYEKYDVTNGSTDNPRRALIEPAALAVGEARPEWDVFADLMRRIDERAAERGLRESKARFGRKVPYGGLWRAFTMDGAVRTQQQALEQLIAIDSSTGLLPPGYDLERFRRDGAIELQGLGSVFHDELNAAVYRPGEPFYSLRDHIEKRKPYPTYARRAQLYIDHEWYLEAGEALPVHKDTPPIGGDHPLRITGGHPRHSIHSIHQTSERFAELHRGQPVVHVHPKAAAERGVRDGDRVRLFNDVGECELMAKVAPTCAPDQVIVYLWDAMLFPGWKTVDDLLVGLPKGLQCAGGYEQIGRYYHGYGVPACSSHRGVRVDFAKA